MINLNEDCCFVWKMMLKYILHVEYFLNNSFREKYTFADVEALHTYNPPTAQIPVDSF